MSERIVTSKGDAKWYTAWKKRIDTGKPREGDYNFIIFGNKGEEVYQPPVDGSKPSVFTNGVWVELETKGS